MMSHGPRDEDRIVFYILRILPRNVIYRLWLSFCHCVPVANHMVVCLRHQIRIIDCQTVNRIVQWILALDD